MTTFADYFNAADEVYESLVAGLDQTTEGIAGSGCTLADLDARWLARVRTWATAHGAPWPPYLPWAEEYALDHRDEW